MTQLNLSEILKKVKNQKKKKEKKGSMKSEAFYHVYTVEQSSYMLKIVH